jgi:prophage maintenance system killer protein
MQERLGFSDLLLIAEAVLGEPAERLHREVSLWQVESALAAPFLSDGPVEVYPDPAERAAICCSRLTRNRPFPRGNREIAYLCMREMLERGGTSWSPSPQVEDEINDVIRALESGTLNEEQFVFWVRSAVASEGGG